MPMPPGNTTTSGRGTSSKVASRSMPKNPFSLRTTPRSCPQNTMSKPGMRWSNSYGPMPSRAVKRGNSGMAICMPSIIAGSVRVRGRAHRHHPGPS